MLITGVGPGSPVKQHPAVTTTEPAPWSAYRDLTYPYGFASFDVVPAERGGTTSITVTQYAAAAGSASYTPRDTFVLRKRIGAGESQGQARRLAGAGARG